MSFSDFADFKRRVRNSLHNTWKNALVLDWIPEEKAQSLSLLQFYVGLRWTKTIKGLQKSKQNLNSIYDILNVIEPNSDGSVICRAVESPSQNTGQGAESPKERSGAKRFWRKLIPTKLLKIKRIWPRRVRGTSPAPPTGPQVPNEEQCLPPTPRIGPAVPNEEQRPFKIFIEGQ